MLLTVDIGNSQTAAGLFEGDQLCAHWATTTCATNTVDEVQLTLAGQLAQNGHSLEQVTNVAIASVVPALTNTWDAVARRVTGNVPVVVGPGVKTGLPMRYDNPAEVGADRVADAVAAIKLVGAPVVVVDLGTATNIEVVDAQGAFRGGCIAPGLATGAAALTRNAARLPQVDLVAPAHVIGTNTGDAMHAGIIYGEVGRIDGLVRRIFSELGYEAPVIATGGFSGLVAELSQTITHREPRLTLQGLRLIFEMNRRR